MTPTPITREAVEARVEWLMQMAAVHANEFAAGMEDSADMLLALLARAEKGEEMALFYKNAFRKMEADFGVVCVERDQLAEQLALREPSALEKDMQVIMAQNNALLAERDEAREYAKEARLREKEAEDRRVHDTDYLTAALAAARKTIEGMRGALEKAREGISASYEQAAHEYQDHDVLAGRSEAIVRHARDAIRAALAQANKTEGE